MESVTNDLLIASETEKHGMYMIHNGSITPNNNGAFEMFGRPETILKWRKKAILGLDYGR